MTPVLILGIGNILLRDEGIGVRVIEAMRDVPLPEGVEILDGGTSGADLIDEIADRRKLIVIDAVKTDVEPAAIFRFTDKDLLARTEGTVSLHEFGLVETLLAAKHLGCAPQEVVIYGIQPKEISSGLNLSAEIAAVVPEVIRLVLEEAAR
jgi:hydrogenase maturation protease